MIETPRIEHTAREDTAVIRLTIPKSEMQSAFAPAIAELLGTAEVQGIEVAGPVFARHFRMDPEVFDFELGMPVSRPVEPSGRVQPGELPAMKVARTIHHGPYDGLPAAWGELHRWLEKEGLSWHPEVVERYLTNPDSDPDPSTWRTELVRPLREEAGQSERV